MRSTPARKRLLHDEPRSLDIVAVNLFRVSRPETIVGGGVKEEPDALQSRRKRGAIARGRPRVPCREDRDLSRGLDGRDQRQHIVPAGAQRRRDRRSEKAARAGDKHARSKRRSQRAVCRRYGRQRLVGRRAFRSNDRDVFRFAITHRNSSKVCHQFQPARSREWTQKQRSEPPIPKKTAPPGGRKPRAPSQVKAGFGGRNLRPHLCVTLPIRFGRCVVVA